MNSDDLNLFAHIVKARSISRAALELGVDQSTISRRIGHLESEVGVRLLHRSGRGVTPTDRGMKLLEFAFAIGRMLDEGIQTIRDSNDQGPSQLHIAAQPTIAKMLFGPLGRAILQRYPRTRLRFVEGLAAQLLENLADGELDVAILYISEQPSLLQSDLLLSEEIRLIAPADCTLPGDSIDVKMLATVPLILPSTQHGLRVMVDSIAIRHGFSTNIALECDGSIALTKRLVMENCGCTILPLAAVMDEVAAAKLKSYRLNDPDIRRNVGLVLGKNRVSPVGLWDIAHLIRARVTELVQSGAWPDAVLDASLAGSNVTPPAPLQRPSDFA